MIEMTLSSRHRIRNSSPGGLRPSNLSVTEAPHNTAATEAVAKMFNDPILKQTPYLNSDLEDSY